MRYLQNNLTTLVGLIAFAFLLPLQAHHDAMSEIIRKREEGEAYITQALAENPTLIVPR